jgi:class 3 adenylate cyclase
VDIGGWLTSVGLGEYAEAFARNHIDAELIKQLTAEDLKDLGVASLGHRKRLLIAIANLDDSVGKSAEADVSADLASPGDRRPVTILFCDLSGFTALSTRSIQG